MKAHLSTLTTVIIFLSLLFGCSVIDPSPKKKKSKPTFEANIEGSISPAFHAEGACDHVFSMYMPIAEVYDNYHALTIQGLDQNGKSLLSLMLYFEGDFPSSPEFHLGLDNPDGPNWGVGNFVSDINNPMFFYSTDDSRTGSCTITEYDRSTQTISGTFSFTAQGYNNGAVLAGAEASFTGTFTNVPINDLTNPNSPQGPCFGNKGNDLGDGGGSGGGGGGSNNGSTSIVFKNNTYTDVSINFDGTSKTVSPNNTVTFSGSAGSSASGEATTSGKTSSGTIIGSELTWNLDLTYPSSGSHSLDLNVGSDYFFLYVTNGSSKNVSKVYVNYGLQSQTLDNITIPADGKTYRTGYYKAWTNSTVRLEESGGGYWYWSSLNLPFTNNQKITVHAID
jgi:hypothetical protein